MCGITDDKAIHDFLLESIMNSEELGEKGVRQGGS